MCSASPGTSLRYRPGFVVGGNVEHDCGTARGVTWFAEPLLLLSLFARRPILATLSGVTSGGIDPGTDVFRSVTLPLVRSAAGLEASALEARVPRRGSAPRGGGTLTLKTTPVASLPVLTWTDEGMVKRIRGVAFATKVSPQTTNRMVDGARGVLNDLLPDVFIFTDHVSGAGCGPSPAYGITLVAETTSSRLLGCEYCSADDGDVKRIVAQVAKAFGGEGEEQGASGDEEKKEKETSSEEESDEDESEENDPFMEDEEASTSGSDDEIPSKSTASLDGRSAPAATSAPAPARGGRRDVFVDSQTTPEDVGRAAACAVLEEVARGGVVDSTHQWLLLTLCALGPDQLSQVRTGPLSPAAVHALRHLREFFGVQFAMKLDRESGTVFSSCVGYGLKNLSKALK